MRKQNVSLAIRTAGIWLLLAAVLSVGAALVMAPRWIMEGEVRSAMRADGLTGRGELLWRGQLPGRFDGGTDYVTVLEEDGRLYAGWLETYEGRHAVLIIRGGGAAPPSAADGPQYTLTLRDGTEAAVGQNGWTLYRTGGEAG